MTPSVMVPSAQPDANPMKEYLDSLTRFETLPADTLVLPSHGLPFRALHTRLAPDARTSSGPLDDVASVVTGKTTAFMIAQRCSRGYCTPIHARLLPSRWPISTCWPRSVG